MRIILIHSNTKDCLLFLSGSYPISCYLPEGDVDMVMITPIRSMSKENNGSNEAGLESDILTFELMQSIYKHATKEQRFVETAPIVTSCSAVDTIPNSLLPYAHLSIRNVEFVNARTKLVHCMVNNTSVDITMNQIGALLGVLLIEDVDKRVGHNHLFKRTLLLIKVSCLCISWS